MKYLIPFLFLFCFESLASSYNRKEWGSWRKDRSCLTTRHQILKEQSLIPVEIKKCKVIKGKWQDFYYNETITDPKEIEIDHVVPLAHAHYHGGDKWNKKQKRNFYNDKENLVITSKKTNRQKGKKDFTEWMPISKDYACKYGKKWFQVKKKYELRISEKEYEYLNMLCSKKTEP